MLFSSAMQGDQGARSWAFLIILLNGLAGHLVSASHFRYGTIYWVPNTNAVNANKYCVDFTMKAAFRRNYKWGQWFKEQWSEDGGVTFTNYQSIFGQPQDQRAKEAFNFSNPNPAKTYYIQFGVGMGQSGYDLAPYTPTDNSRGKICDTPNEKGWSLTNKLFPAGTAGPLDSRNSPILNGSMVCAPWAETFGFFFGDGQYGNLNLKVEDIDTTMSIIGNTIKGQSSSLTHCYATPRNTNNNPWLAFFTGGNRIQNLNNNANGRYRLEVEVIVPTGMVKNRSPVVGQLPVLPIPYTDGPNHVRFQIAAFDPDIGTALKFRLGTSQEHGALMAHALPLYEGYTQNTWYEDAYTNYACNFICRDMNAKGCNGKRVIPTWCPNYNASNPNIVPRRDWTGDLRKWVSSEFDPAPPKDLDIDENTGFVTFRTGRSPWQDSSPEIAQNLSTVSYPAKKPGFYNLVVMVQDGKNENLKVPIDFLLYLYPPMYYCSIGCNTSTAATKLQTFANPQGLYGHPSTAPFVYKAAGTGSCAVCGGGGVATDPDAATSSININYFQYGLLNNTYCAVKNIRTNNPINTGNPSFLQSGRSRSYTCVAGTRCDQAVNPSTALEMGEGSCMGTRDVNTQTIVPYRNGLSVCKINQVPYFMTTDNKSPKRKGTTPPMTMNPDNTWSAKLTYQKKVNVSFTLQATDEDECVELSIDWTGHVSGMDLTDPVRIDPFSIERTFVWPPQLGPDGNDTRETPVTICFYAFDNYLITANPFHCVVIELQDASDVLWCDERQGAKGLADGSTYDAFLGEETCLPLCIRRNSEASRATDLEIRMLKSGTVELPSTTMKFPYDETNFPLSGHFVPGPDGSNPMWTSYCFTPTVKEECAYTVCFQGIDNKSQKKEVTVPRCFKIEVKNTVLEFQLSQATGLMSQQLSGNIFPNRGLSIAAWVYPSCLLRNANETVLYFGSFRNFGKAADPGGKDNGLRTRNALKWIYGPLGGQFFYYDCYIGEVYSPPYYSCDTWHYVTISIAPNNSAFLVVDNIQRGHRLNNRRDVYKWSVTPFSTPSRPDNNVDGDAQGVFIVGLSEGERFVGMLDEVRVWNRNLSVSEVLGKMFARQLDPEEEDSLAGYYTMRPDPLRQVAWYDTTGNMQYSQTRYAGTIKDMSLNGNRLSALANPVNYTVDTPDLPHFPIPPMIPCVLGLEHTVGPCDGDCTMSVYGWSIAPSTMLKCKFGDVEVIGTFLHNDEVRCNTPGHFSPRYVTVTLSNDGINFTDTTWAAKTVQHLYLESSLYVDGTTYSGAQADSVCQNLPTNTVTFGGWFCPRCGPAGARDPPPSPPPNSPPPRSPPPRPPPPPPPSPPPPQESGE